VRRQPVRLPDPAAAACRRVGAESLTLDALELPRDASRVWRQPGFRVEYDESRLAGNNRLRSHGTGLRKWLENNPLASPIRVRFLATHRAEGKLRAAPACTPASPPTTSNLFSCRAGPCASTQRGEAGALLCRCERSVPEHASANSETNCSTRRARREIGRSNEFPIDGNRGLRAHLMTIYVS